VDYEVNVALSQKLEPKQHVLAVVDTSSSMVPLLTDVKGALQGVANRDDVHMHLTAYQEIKEDEAPVQNIAKDKMDLKAGEIVSLSSDISAIRIRFGQPWTSTPLRTCALCIGLSV